MALGVEQAIAEFLASPPAPQPSFGGLYNDADPAQRVIWVNEQPPVATDDTDEPDAATDFMTTSQLGITVFLDPGGPPQLLIGETFAITIQVRHPSSETALETSRAIYQLLQENGGQGNGANPLAQGVFRGIKIWRITADSTPTPLGRDRDGLDGRFIVTQTFTVRTKPFAFS